MLDSVLLMLTVCAAVLLVPAFAALLGVERHRHLAQSEDSTRRARVAVAATLVGLAALATTALLDADPVPALAVAAVLALSVLVWSPLSRSWAVRGVVVWALLVSGVLGFMAWLAQQIWVTTLSAGERLVSVAGWLLLLLAITRVQHYVRPVIGAQAGLVPGEAVAQHIPILRPVLSLVALLAASGVVVAVTTDDNGTAGDDRTPQAGLTGSSGTGEPGPAGPTLSASPTTTPSATRTGGPVPDGGGTTNVLFAGGGDVVAGVSVERPAAVIVPPGASCPTTGPADPGGVGAPSKSLGAKPKPGAGPDAGRTPRGPKPSGGGAAPSTSKPEPMPGAKPGPAQPGSAPAPDPGEPLITNPDAVPSPVVTEIARSLGFDKDKPNRPSKAPAPAAGRPDHAHTPVPPASESPTRQPTIYPTTPVPVPPAPAPPEPVPLDDKTYGYEKEKPNRPAGAPSPGHGRPSAS